MTAALGVILDPASNTQQFFGGGEVENTAKNVAKDNNHHTDDVMAIRLCPQRMTAVSGQVGSSPTIFKWDATTGEKKQRIKIGKGARGIKAVAITEDGWVAAVDLHNEHQVYVYDADGQCVWKEKGDTNMIHDVCWDVNSKRFATAGVKHIYFWNASSPTGDKKKGLFSGKSQTSFACVAFDDQGKCWTGGSNGCVYVWGGDDGRTCEAQLDCDKGFISAIRFAEGSIYSGGKDGKVHCWDTVNRTVTRTWELSYVRSIDCFNGQMLTGHKNGTINCFEPDSEPNAIMMSHCEGEVWGLDKTDEGEIVTSGDDNKVMFWNPTDRKSTKTCIVSETAKKLRRRGASTFSKKPDSQCSRSVCCNSTWLAVASNYGIVSVRSASDPNTVVHTLTDSKEWIEVMAFSPNGEYLAVGSHDNNIYVYSTSDFSLVGTCRAHNSYVMALDWCVESKYIRSNCGAYELLFFTVPDCQQDKSGRTNTTGTTWATKTVKFSWNTDGIFPRGVDGTHINSVCGSADGMLLATGDDYGLVNLFNDPVRKGHMPRSFRGHSEHVVRVMFANDDSKLWSIGGYDQTLMQW